MTQTGLLEDMDGSVVSREGAGFDPVEPQCAESDLAHRPGRLGRVPVPPERGPDPVSEFRDPVDGRQMAQLDHSNESIVGGRDHQGERLPAAKSSAFLLHKLDRVSS